MGKFRLFGAFLVFGLAVPFGLYKLSRLTGLPLLMAAAVALGLAYGALKAEHPWSGDGLAANLLLMATSALVLAAYVGVSLAAAKIIARTRR